MNPTTMKKKQRLKTSQVRELEKQIAAAKKDLRSWPQWMRRACRFEGLDASQRDWMRS